VAADYTGWPTAEDVQERLASVGIVLRGASDVQTSRINAVSAAVTAYVAKRTLRQFVADDAASVRYFDGTGTASLEVDEFVEFLGATAIGLNADPGYPLANVITHYEQGKPRTWLLRGQGGLPAFQVAAVYQPVPTIFPLGRQNIAVTARWGYGETIPVDIWEAVACETARRVGNEAINRPGGGITISYQDGDEKRTYAKGGLDAVFSIQSFNRAIGDYRARPGRMLRNARPPMI
jgi:hypothetical protein